MIEIEIVFISLFFSFVLNYLFLKFDLLLDHKYSQHKSLASKALVPISGGLIFFTIYFFFIDSNFYYFLPILFVFGLGILSDINLLKTPRIRFFFQIFFILILIVLNQNLISSIRIPFFDDLLRNKFFSYFFTLFCLLVLINGSNFIDGVNTLLIGYYLIISLILLFLINSQNFDIDINIFKVISSILSVILLLNFFGKMFCGDGGAYVISLILGFQMISMPSINPLISPYFIACLLWYPAYECLFSMIRKKIYKSDVTKADNSHLHQLIFKFFSIKLNYKKWIISSMTGMAINVYNFFVFLLSYNFFSQTKLLIIIIMMNIFLYNIIFFFLKKKIH